MKWIKNWEVPEWILFSIIVFTIAICVAMFFIPQNPSCKPTGHYVLVGKVLVEQKQCLEPY